MAIGDAVAALLGTGTVNRQPASGVEEQISAVLDNATTTDHLVVYDGTNTANLLNAAASPAAQDSDSSAKTGAYNTAVMITNSVYLRKEGSTDRYYVGGVQTNV